MKKAAEAGEVVDVSKKVGELIADMSCRMILGTNREESYHLKELVHEGFCLVGAFNVADYLPCLEPFDLQVRSNSFIVFPGHIYLTVKERNRNVIGLESKINE